MLSRRLLSNLLSPLVKKLHKDVVMIAAFNYSVLLPILAFVFLVLMFLGASYTPDVEAAQNLTYIIMAIAAFIALSIIIGEVIYLRRLRKHPWFNLLVIVLLGLLIPPLAVFVVGTVIIIGLGFIFHLLIGE